MKLKVAAKLDPQFAPLSLVVREMKEATKENGQDIVIAIERDENFVATYKTRIYPDNSGHDEENFKFVERIVKSMAWIVGGYKVIIAGSPVVGEKIKEAYSKTGSRAFDVGMMERVFEKDIVVELRSIEDAPKTNLPPPPWAGIWTVAASALTQAEATER